MAKVAIPVVDQQRAQAFWTGTLGFRTVIDAPYDESGSVRWIEVESPDRAIRLVLDQQPAVPTMPAELPSLPVFFYTDDLAAAHAELTAAGVAFPQPPIEQPWGTWSMFVDSEGNRFPLQER